MSDLKRTERGRRKRTCSPQTRGNSHHARGRHYRRNKLSPYKVACSGKGTDGEARRRLRGRELEPGELVPVRRPAPSAHGQGRLRGIRVQFKVRNLRRNGQAKGATSSEDEARVRVREGRVNIWAEVGQPTGTQVGRRQGTGGQSRPGEAGVTGESSSGTGRGRAGRSPAGVDERVPGSVSFSRPVDACPASPPASPRVRTLSIIYQKAREKRHVTRQLRKANITACPPNPARPQIRSTLHVGFAGTSYTWNSVCVHQ